MIYCITKDNEEVSVCIKCITNFDNAGDASPLASEGERSKDNVCHYCGSIEK